MGTESAEFHCWYSTNLEEARKKGQDALGKYGKYLKGPIVDLGCGEGALLLALKESGKADAVGVESNKELADLAESWGVVVVRKDLLAYLREEVAEHVPFEVELEV